MVRLMDRNSGASMVGFRWRILDSFQFYRQEEIFLFI